MIYFEDAEEQNNIVLLVEWMPFINNAKNIITFKCLHEDKLYLSSTNALLEIIR
jgi:hypothetical protein